jgi:hypothetical protein
MEGSDSILNLSVQLTCTDGAVGLTVSDSLTECDYPAGEICGIATIGSFSCDPLMVEFTDFGVCNACFNAVSETTGLAIDSITFTV